MLTDAALKHLKPKDKPYKIRDRDGMYAHIAVIGTITFRFDYRIHGRRETVVFRKYTLRSLPRPGSREVHRCEAADRRGSIAGDREAARETSPEGSEDLRRVWREVDEVGADGRQHACDTPRNFRARRASRLVSWSRCG